MSIVYLKDQKLWVENDIAYVVDDVKSEHESLLKTIEEKRAELGQVEVDIESLSKEVDDLKSKKEELVAEISKLLSESAEKEAVLNKIDNSENEVIEEVEEVTSPEEEAGQEEIVTVPEVLEEVVEEPKTLKAKIGGSKKRIIL